MRATKISIIKSAIQAGLPLSYLPMKQLLLAILLLCIVLACSKNEEEAQPDYGTATVLLNESSWKASSSGAGTSVCYPTRLSMGFGFFPEDNYRQITFTFGSFPTKAGNYRLFPSDQSSCGSEHTTVSWGVLIGGDVGGITHELVDTAENELVVVAYDSLTQRLEGTFRMTLALEEWLRPGRPNFPDTARVQGLFSVVVRPSFDER